MDALQTLLGSISPDDFRRDYLGQKAFHVKGDASKYRSFFSWDALNRVLNSAPSPHPSCRLYKDAERPVRVSDAIDIIRETRDGATFIVQDIDRYDAILGNFLERLSNEIGESTRFNMYASYPGRQGFPLHYDTHDFFIVQAEGYKRWRVFPATEESPMFVRKRHEAEPPSEDTLYLDCVLGPGDTLYVPKGHWHEALAKQEPSLHLTLAIFFRNGVDLLSWLADEFRELPQFRRSFPLIFEQEREANTVPDSFIRHITALRDQLIQRLTDDHRILSDYRSFRIGTEKYRQPFRFPNHMLGDAIPTRGQFIRHPHSVEIRTDAEDGVVQVITGGRLLRFRSSAEELVRFLFSSDRFSRSDLDENVHLEPSQLEPVIMRLIQEGLISPV